MGKQAVRRKKGQQYQGQSDAVTNMVVMDEYRQRTERKTPLFTYRYKYQSRNERQDIMEKAINSNRNRVTFGIGAPGTGKTKVAVSCALKLLSTPGNKYDKIYITRPAIEAEGEKIGFLKGGIEEKMHPYFIPIYDILEEELGTELFENLLKRKVIEIAPLAFLRGRTLKNAIVILDEMQNATYAQIKMALTRIGENSKFVLTGDPSQSDRKGVSGFMEAADKLRTAPGFTIVDFLEEDVVRDEMVKVVLEYL
jgi:phosphate starvation-inducible PhoH-like protein